MDNPEDNPEERSHWGMFALVLLVVIVSLLPAVDYILGRIAPAQ